MIGVINYGSGNVQAIKNIYRSLDINHCEVSSENKNYEVDRLILPGVGDYDETLDMLEKSGLSEYLKKMVLEKKIPILGICVGMQIMGTRSEEGDSLGLNWIKGDVKKFSSSNKLPTPHMGWNSLMSQKSNLFTNINLQEGYYFMHSYYFEVEDKKNCIAECNYGNIFSCAINKNNIYGVQFHPEKSHSNGIQLYKNFSSIRNA